MKKVAAFFLLSSAAFASQPEFRVTEGAWRIKARDFKNTTEESWVPERRYSSRSHHAGAFGLGWCSDFDEHLIVIDTHHLILKQCEQVTHFRSLSPTAEPPAVLVADGAVPSQIARRADGTFRRSTSFSTHHYDSRGRLARLERPSSKPVLFEYTQSGLLRSVQVEGQRPFELRWENGRVVRILGPKSLQVVYIYEGLNLYRVIDSEGQISQYRYDDDQNMSIVAQEGRLQWQISYDREADAVARVSNAQGCRVKLSASLSKAMMQDCSRSQRGFAGSDQIHVAHEGKEE